MVTLLSDLLSESYMVSYDQSNELFTKWPELHGDGLTKWPERKLLSDLLTKLLSNLLSS